MALKAALGWSGVQTAVRMALGFFSAKVSSVYLGPAGTALVGQLGSFIQLLQGAVGNGASTGVVNLTAESIGQPERLQALWGTALSLVLTLAGALALGAALVSVPLASWLLTDSDYWPAIIAAALAVVLVVADSVITSALNGLKQIDLIAKVSIASAVGEFCVFTLLVYSFGLRGGLLGIASVYAIKLTITCTVAFRSGLFPLCALTSAFEPQTARKLLRYYPMLIAHSIALPLGQILVRDSVIGRLGLEQGGYLQATWRLSDMYVGVITTALGLFFMAHFSALSKNTERGAMLRLTVLQVLGIMSLAVPAIYLLRNYIIQLVLTRQFLPMGDLLPMHLLGDVFKMIDYPLQMALVAQRKMTWYIAQATGGPVIFVLITHTSLPVLGAQAAPTAYAISFFVMMCALVFANWGTLTAKEI